MKDSKKPSHPSAMIDTKPGHKPTKFSHKPTRAEAKDHKHELGVNKSYLIVGDQPLIGLNRVPSFKDGKPGGLNLQNGTAKKYWAQSMEEGGAFNYYLLLKEKVQHIIELPHPKENIIARVVADNGTFFTACHFASTMILVARSRNDPQCQIHSPTFLGLHETTECISEGELLFRFLRDGGDDEFRSIQELEEAYIDRHGSEGHASLLSKYHGLRALPIMKHVRACVATAENLTWPSFDEVSDQQKVTEIALAEFCISYFLRRLAENDARVSELMSIVDESVRHVIIYSDCDLSGYKEHSWKELSKLKAIDLHDIGIYKSETSGWDQLLERRSARYYTPLTSGLAA